MLYKWRENKNAEAAEANAFEISQIPNCNTRRLDNRERVSNNFACEMQRRLVAIFIREKDHDFSY